MAEFRIKKGQDNYDFDSTGTAKKNGTALGKWTTTNDAVSSLVINKDAGGQETFPVEWRFNADNHLCVFSGGNQAFDFNVPGARPIYLTRNAVLIVRPNQNNAFSFNLKGEWDMDANHNLSFTVNNVTSSLDGFIFDQRSRFMYHFFNKNDITQESILGFVGEWESFVDNADGKLKLKFKYKREDNSIDTFALPKSMKINKSVNQFMYEYQKQNHSFRVQFAGFLQVNENLEITYSIDRQVSSGGEEQVSSTTFRIGAVFNKTNFSGDVELIVKKTNGTVGTTTISIGGKFSAVLGHTNLQVAFAFSQVRGPNTVVTTFGFEGKLDFQNGSVVWKFARNATTTTIAISASDIKLGNARIDSRLNIVKGPNDQVGVYFLFGVAF
ncbi:MAG TPA: hypothetical protein VEV42_08675 [Pyrinomonadaceae bacterium]|nr:hypothetical protein [Pyrinomonadaceae bacterium]